MAIAFRSDAVTVDTDGGTVAANQPSGATAGDGAIAFAISYDQNGTNITASGWNSYRQADVSQTGREWHWAFLWRILTGSDNWDFVFPATYTNLYIACYTGTDSTMLVDTGSANSGTGTTATGTGVTVTTDGSFLIFAHGGYEASLSVDPAGFNVREVEIDGVNNFFDLSVSSGATGDKTATVAASSQWSVGMGVIAPASGGGGGGEVVTPEHISTLSFPCFCRKPANDNGRWIRSQGGLFVAQAPRVAVPKRRAA